MERPKDTPPETGPESNSGYLELPGSLIDCSRLIAGTLLMEQHYAESLKNEEKARTTWFEERDRATENNPEARAAAQNCKAASSRYFEAKDPNQPRSADAPSPGVLRKDLDRANKLQASANDKAINKSAAVAQARASLLETSAVRHELETALPQAQKTILRSLGLLLDGQKMSWDILKMRLGSQFKQKLLASGQQLAEAEACHEQNIAEMPFKLHSLSDSPRSGRNKGHSAPRSRRNKRNTGKGRKRQNRLGRL